MPLANVIILTFHPINGVRIKTGIREGIPVTIQRHQGISIQWYDGTGHSWHSQMSLLLEIKIGITHMVAHGEEWHLLVAGAALEAPCFLEQNWNHRTCYGAVNRLCLIYTIPGILGLCIQIYESSGAFEHLQSQVQSLRSLQVWVFSTTSYPYKLLVDCRHFPNHWRVMHGHGHGMEGPHLVTKAALVDKAVKVKNKARIDH